MLFQSLIPILLASASAVEARSARRHLDFHKRATATTSDDSSLTLDAAVIQSGSFADGLQEVGGNEAFEAASATSTNNFINFCSGKTLTNGLQITTGSCNGIPMGNLPAKTKMVSSMITFPVAGSTTIQSDTTFNITVQMSNIVAGSFTNADATYFSAPQDLSNGVVIGHTHVTVQDMGASLNPTVALDPTQFAFFKGINDAGNGQGLLSATVLNGLPAGNYRVCTMASSSNHQPVIMPVAQRGTADDCTKFTVVGSGTTANVASNDGTTGQAAAALAASAVAAGPDNTNSASSGSVAASTGSSAVASSASKSSAGGKSANSITSSSSSKAGKAAVATTTSASSVSSATSVSVDTASAVSTKSSSKNGQGGTVSVVQIITFFEFSQGLGGVPPPVAGKGNAFVVLEELFEELADAAAAACGHQFESCVSFQDASFSETACAEQSASCAGAASTATSTPAAPTTITATQTVPQTSSAAATSTSVALSSSAQVDIASTSTSAASTLSAPTAAPFSNSTIPATSAVSSSSSTTVALGGIAAPAVSDSGDSTRPFEVNGDTFVNQAAALQRSCDVQFNACADAFNGGTAVGFTISDCQTQENSCLAG